MVLTLDQLPAPHRTLAEVFAGELESTLGDAFAGLFLYGAACFRPTIAADFDYHVLLGRPLDDADRKELDRLHDRLEREVPLGDDMDGYYVTLEAAARPERPAHERHAGVLDWSWALHRAHVHGGRYAVISGVDPATIVPVPAWDELDDALQGELEFVTKHVRDGDSAAYCALNLCRILYSYEARDVVASKYQAALWALAALDPGFHALIRASLDAYIGTPDDQNRTLRGGIDAFYDEMVLRIAQTRAK